MTEIKAELRGLYSAEMDLGRQFPPDPECFGLRIDAEIGPSDALGADRFTIIVCTPRWLSERLGKVGHKWGAGLLIVPSWNPEVVRLAVKSMCERTRGPDWQAIVRQLEKYAEWEFHA